MGIIDNPQVQSVQIDGEDAAIFGKSFAKQIVYPDSGEKTVTAIGNIITPSLPDSTTPFSDSVNFTVEPEETDTTAPIVKILFPEEGTNLRSRFIEVMGTVEEGGTLTSLSIDNIPAHSMIGNIFMVYAELENEGENTIRVTARDQEGNIGQDFVSVFLDSISPELPTVDETPALTDQRIFQIIGTAGAGETIVVLGGLTTVRTITNPDGTYAVSVPLVPNTTNFLEIFAEDDSGNQSDSLGVTLIHDDTAPTILATNPGDANSGVSTDQRISITFSEPMNPDSFILADTGGSTPSFSVTNSTNQEIPGNIIFSANKTIATFIPAAKFQRDDTITVALSETLTDQNGYSLNAPYAFTFHTALFKTTLSGVVIDNNLRPIEGVPVGIIALPGLVDFDSSASNQNSEIIILKSSVTNSFGAFLLDDVPLGPHILYVNGTAITNSSTPQNSNTPILQHYSYLEFEVNIIENTDNTLGRPIFLVPADLSTLTPIHPNVGGDVSVGDSASLEGFSLSYEARAITFADGSTNGTITATKIQPAFIPDRLPDGSIPHFLVHLKSIHNSQSTIGNSQNSSTPSLQYSNFTFSPAASLTFPNIYDLEVGEKVKVFHFQYGVHNYSELGEVTVSADGSIITAPILFESGFIGIVPSDPEFDLAKNYLRGRVADTNGNGIPNIPVNAIAGTTTVITDENGEYVITMPEVRVFVIQTFASIPTNLSTNNVGGDVPVGDSSSNILVFQSSLTDVSPSGITEIPDIIVDTFFIGGSIRFVSTDGIKLPRTGTGYDAGTLVSLDNSLANNVNIYIYRQIPVPPSGMGGDVPVGDLWESTAYANSTTNLDPFNLGFDASFSIPIVGSMDDENNVGGGVPSANAIKPGDLIKIIAFSPDTGWYGETDLKIPSFSDPSAILNLQSKIDIDLRPPVLEVDMNRVFFIDGIRRRANIPQEGIVFTSDEFVEIKVNWTIPDLVPLNRDEIQFDARLMINSLSNVGGDDPVGDSSDHFFQINGGEHTHILEIREALFPNRLDVLQKETDVGTETFTFSPNGSFAQETLVPVTIKTDSYGLPNSTTPTLQHSPTPKFYVVDLSITQQPDGTFLAEGRAQPGLQITIGDQTINAGEDGRFSTSLADLPDSGIPVKIGDTTATLVGASFTPELETINPTQGSQGDIVTLTGQFFSIIPDENNVKFNGAAAEVTSTSETELAVIVPEDASAGDVTVAGKTSNGIFYDFVSEGLPNGSFEFGSFKGFSHNGNAQITESIRSIVPTDRDFMAFLSTLDNPKSGTASLTSDRFIVPTGQDYLVFDYSFLGTLVFGNFSEYLEFFIIEADSEIPVPSFIPSDITKLHLANISGYNTGSTFRTTAIDVSTYTGQDIPIRFKIVLHGRGQIPAFIPGRRNDDDNPLDITKLQGTGILLDNFRLTASSTLPIKPDISTISTGAPADGNASISGNLGTAGAAATIYAHGIQNGLLQQATAAPDGSFNFSVPTCNQVDTYYAFYYSTPKTVTDNTSDRLFSPSIILKIENQ